MVTATGNGNILETIANGIAAEAGDAKVTTLNVSVTATAINTADGETYANAILAGDGSNVTKFDGNITAVAEGEGTLAARGVNLWSDETVTNLGVVDISAKTIGGSTENGNWIDSIGVWTRDGSTANIAGGSITAEAYNSDEVTVNNDANIYAILSDGTSFVNVNQGTNNDVVINGNIETRSDSTVKLNLNTINSELNGAIDDNSDNGTTLTLANGAEWNNTDASNVTNVSMNDGIINQNTDEDIDIENYSGVGEIVLSVGDNISNGDIDVDAGRTNITSADEGSVINMSVNNNNFIGTTDSAQALANLNQIANEISYDDNDGHITGKVTIKEGLIMPEASGDLLFYEDNSNGHTAGQGYVANVKQNSSTTTIDNIKNIAATAIVAWRQEDSTLSQRLGELRESDGGQGIWVRMSRGEFEYDGEYKNQYNFFQMGYDWAAGSWHYGAAVSHNDGQTTYTHGDGENRSTSLSLYGTWLGDKGHYADIVLKQGRLSNDFDIYTEAGHTSGDYDAWGISLSGEYGMKVDLDGGWYVTPQAQLTLMRIGGEDYTTNNGIKVNQDSLESAVGRVGFEVGKRISDSGSIYAKASLLHDFAGSADTYLSLSGLTNSYHQDIGDTWCEAGIGFNYKTSENSYLTAKAQLAQAEAQEVNARNNLSYTEVKSPSDGVVGMLPYRAGALVSASIPQPLTTVSDNSNMYVYFSMTENQLLAMSRQYKSMDEALKNMPEVSLKLNDQSIYEQKGKIESISGVIDRKTGTVGVRAVFPNESRLLHSGASGNVLIPQTYKDCIVIPQGATVRLQDKTLVYKVVDGKAVSTLITVAEINDGREYIVLDGLKVGEEIVSEGAGLVREGTQVK